ncbi:peptidyl-prolyl cis-trans isomerase [Duganella sp. BJB488]|uniref:peptidylprolyl isomerase n=1 Tax=unclassified Duganella TaxID=2636909 RepID=UPI000E3405BF|nr:MULTISPECIES: peptidylprolyl isomerase [unclassified Duganella]RFP15410.1 peptidyl-prolyl cis-trans isomerase [Duganella sp. BJB489]RFP19966.1 peptidyl-prolyl cis-trans isomerase [Duganella sp. BJB488]RFP38354.1 peptidyl-prolyl cis-trans isomerase [Duganella sp. BJB480]
MHQTQPSLFAKLMTLFAGVTLSGAALAATPAPANPTPQVEIKTSMGDIVVELNHEKAPKSVDNFLTYVKAGFYKGTIFHRVIDGFMIQGGGFDEKLKQKKTNPPVPIESQNGLTNNTYTLAMARTGDPNSATSQFFINVADNDALNYPGRDGFGYTVFGKVIKGQEVVDKIKGVLVDDKGMFQNIPVIPVVIKSATILKTPIQPKL